MTPEQQKSAEDILKEALGEIRYKLNGTITNEQLKWAMEEYAAIKVKAEREETIKFLDEQIKDLRNLIKDQKELGHIQAAYDSVTSAMALAQFKELYLTKRI